MAVMKYKTHDGKESKRVRLPKEDECVRRTLDAFLYHGRLPSRLVLLRVFGTTLHTNDDLLCSIHIYVIVL